MPGSIGEIMHCGLYIHTPFCETKCGYCDFYSVALKGRSTATLVDAILRELDLRLTATDLPISTVFIGGGTPTLLDFADLARLLRRVRQLVDSRASRSRLVEVSEELEGSEESEGRRLSAGTGIVGVAPRPGDELLEFTVEANPATVDDAKAALLAENGVTRVSMGAQSFFAAELAALERLHSPDDVAPSVDALRRHGIQQLNIDLIFGIPGQTPATWAQSLQRAVELEPDHIACYGLTYEPGTRLTAQQEAGRVVPCDEGLEADMYVQMVETLAAVGFEQYEISNFARPGCECRHNLIYWRNEPYIGIGPSAVGCYAGSQLMPGNVDGGGQGRPSGPGPVGDVAASRDPSAPRRYKNVPDIAQYTRAIRSAGCAEFESEVVEGETLVHEIILMQLRLNEGISVASFRDRTGRDPAEVFGEGLRKIVAEGLLDTLGERIALTPRGRLVANRAMTDLAAAVSW